MQNVACSHATSGHATSENEFYRDDQLTITLRLVAGKELAPCDLSCVFSILPFGFNSIIQIDATLSIVNCDVRLPLLSWDFNYNTHFSSVSQSCKNDITSISGIMKYNCIKTQNRAANMNLFVIVVAEANYIVTFPKPCKLYYVESGSQAILVPFSEASICRCQGQEMC